LASASLFARRIFFAVLSPLACGCGCGCGCGGSTDAGVAAAALDATDGESSLDDMSMSIADEEDMDGHTERDGELADS
jgi:hypothetical protein